MIPLRITAGASRVASDPHRLHAVATTPAGPSEPVRSYRSVVVGLPRVMGGSAPALCFSRPAQRLLTLRPACSPSRYRDPLHRRLQRLRCLRRCFDCYRVERTSSRAGLSPAVDQCLSRRTITLHWVAELIAAAAARQEGLFHSTVTLLARFIGCSALAISMVGKIFGRTSV